MGGPGGTRIIDRQGPQLTAHFIFFLPLLSPPLPPRLSRHGSASAVRTSFLNPPLSLARTLAPPSAPCTAVHARQNPSVL
jgi:hypothetical protein